MCKTTKGIVNFLQDESSPKIVGSKSWPTRGTEWLDKHKATLFMYKGRKDVLVHVPEVDDVMELGDLLKLNIETSRIWRERLQKVMEKSDA